MAVAARRPLAERRRQSSLPSLRDCPWWTPADAAELDVLWRALTLGIPWHQDRCPAVAEAREQGLYPWCRHLTGAVEEVLEWRDAREAYSRAVWMRAHLG